MKQRNENGEAGAESEKYSAPAVTKLLNIIELLSGTQKGLSINEIARLTGSPVNSVYRICLVLESRGYIEKDFYTGLYQLGMSFHAIGEAAAGRISLRRYALPLMDSLCDECGETVHLCVFSGGKLILLDQAETKQPIKIHVESGSALFPHASAFGKAIMAHLEENEPCGFAPDGLVRLTPHTIISAELLKKQFEEIRLSNTAYDMEEYMEGVVCIGSAVFGKSGKVAGAIGIMGPKYRFDDEKFASCVKSVRYHAEALSKKLGYSAAAPGQITCP